MPSQVCPSCQPLFTMKVKFVAPISAVDRAFNVGESVDLDDTLAGQWISSGYCIPVEVPAQAPADAVPSEAHPDPVDAPAKKSAKKKG